MVRTRGGGGRGRGRGGRGRGRGRGAYDEQHGNSNDGNEALTKLREEISSLKRRAYKSLLWSLRMDHQKIDWRLELAIEEIKRALGISQSEHTDIVISLDKDFRNFEAELNRRVRVATSDFEPDVRRTNTSSFPENMETNEDEGQNPRQYNEYIVGKEAWINWPADGKFRRVLIIDYDMLNGAHEILHLEENLYEWLNLNELLPQDIRFSHQIQEGEITGDTIQIYETEQLISVVEQVLTETSEPVLLNQALKYLEKQKGYLDTGLKAIGHRIGELREQKGHQFAEDGDNDDDEYMVDEDNEEDDNEDVNDDEQEKQYDSSDREIDGSDNKEGSDDENGGDGAIGDRNERSDSDDVSSDSDS